MPNYSFDDYLASVQQCTAMNQRLRSGRAIDGAHDPTPTNQTTTDQTQQAFTGDTSAIVRSARTYLGIPYKYGGRLPDTVDCSLLVQAVFADNGIKLPRTAEQQMQIGSPIDVPNLQPGDRVYWENVFGYAKHTGIYIGNGLIIHASSGQGKVVIAKLDSIGRNSYGGARR